jgi:hypothetical protein
VVSICTTRFYIKNHTFCPHSVFMCFVWIWEQTAIISLYSINWLVFITETVSVYCAVRAQSWIEILIIAETRFRFEANSCEICAGHSGILTCFPPSTLVFPCQYYVYFTNAPHSHLSTGCCYQKDKRARPGNLQKQCSFVNRKTLDRKKNFRFISSAIGCFVLLSIPLFVGMIAACL